MRRDSIKFLELAKDVVMDGAGTEYTLAAEFQRIDREAREECALICDRLAAENGEVLTLDYKQASPESYRIVQAYKRRAEDCANRIRASAQAPAEGSGT